MSDERWTLSLSRLRPAEVIMAVSLASLMAAELVLTRAVGKQLLPATAWLAALFAIAALDEYRRTPTTRFVRAWFAAPFVLFAYFAATRMVASWPAHGGADEMLYAFDRRILGDPAAALTRLASRPLSDFLTLCYWSYYPLPLIFLAFFYNREEAHFERAQAVLLCGFVFSFAGYFFFPAFGPHLVFETARAPALAGYGFSQWAHAALMRVEGRVPDAFPSGHTAIAILVLTLAWRLRRALFYWLLPFSLGIVLATVYLRYHYVVDVLAGIAVVPLCHYVGDRLIALMHGLSVAPSDKERSYASAP